MTVSDLEWGEKGKEGIEQRNWARREEVYEYKMKISGGDVSGRRGHQLKTTTIKS